MSVGRLAGCDRGLVSCGAGVGLLWWRVLLACLLVGCVGCFQVGWGGLGVLC